MLKTLSKFSLRTEILVTFLVVATIPLLLLSWLSSQRSTSALEDSIYQKLTAVQATKEKEIREPQLWHWHISRCWKKLKSVVPLRMDTRERMRMPWGSFLFLQIADYVCYVDKNRSLIQITLQKWLCV